MSPIISVLAETTLLEIACHFLLLFVGFDTLTYRKDYDRSPILVGHQRSLFVGLNYPINQEITDDKDHDGSAFRSSGKNMCTRCTMRLSMHHTLICAATLCGPK